MCKESRAAARRKSVPKNENWFRRISMWGDVINHIRVNNFWWTVWTVWFHMSIKRTSVGTIGKLRVEKQVLQLGCVQSFSDFWWRYVTSHCTSRQATGMWEDPVNQQYTFVSVGPPLTPSGKLNSWKIKLFVTELNCNKNKNKYYRVISTNFETILCFEPPIVV